MTTVRTPIGLPSLTPEHGAADTDTLRVRVFEWTARSLAAEGKERIALFGGGRHTRPLVRQPWARVGLSVVAIFDEAPSAGFLGGVPVLRPEDWLNAGTEPAPGFDALVISSAVYENALAQRAEATLGPALERLGIPIVRPYRGGVTSPDNEQLVQNIIECGGRSEDEARWLVANKDERHDATLPMIAPDRTEFHLRRYEFAAEYLSALERRVVADIACGLGYGARLLVGQGGAERYTGVDIDPQAIEYAARHHTVSPCVSFQANPADRTSIEAGSVDLIASFETIEHVEGTDSLLREFVRVLRPDGTLIVSTPNALGLTPYHVHDFDVSSFERALSRWFTIEAWYGQLPVDEVYDAPLPPGLFPLDLPAARAHEPDRLGRTPHVLLAVCKPHAGASENADECVVSTVHGPLRLQCPSRLARWRAETFFDKEPETLEWIDAFADGDVFWDIGANIGLYSLYAAAGKRVSRVLAFEPSPWNTALLAEHIRINDLADTIAAYPLALSDATCPGTLFMRHTTPASAGSSFAEPVGEFGEQFSPVFEQAALGVRIDDLVAWGAPLPNRIKIDVDGAEERVLAGAVQTLRNPAMRSLSIELDASREDLIERVTRTLATAGLELTAQRHAPEFATGINESIYNFQFTRPG